MIKSFKGKCSHDIYHGLKTKASRKLPVYLRKLAAEKLDMIDAANQLNDLKTPPGNRLEALRGNLRGVSIALELTSSGELFLNGSYLPLKMWKLLITTRGEKTCYQIKDNLHTQEKS